MSYKFAQFRRGQINSYMTSLDYSLEDIESQSPLSQGVNFIDKTIILPLQSTDNTGKNIKSYYFNLKIFKQEEAEQIITIKLVNTDKQKDNKQIIDTVTVPQGTENDYSAFEFIFAPNQYYNQIQIVLNRVLIDYNIENKDGSYGRKINLQVLKLNEVYNVIDYLNPSIENKGRLKQIGVQSAPGLLMSIDGEAIKVGRSGIYEINNGISIKNIGFIVEPDDNKYFLLDYQY